MEPSAVGAPRSAFDLWCLVWRAGLVVTEPLYTPAEVAERCRCSTKTVMRAIHAQELEASQLGERGTWVIREHAIDDWIERRSNRTRPPRPLADVRRVDPQPAAPARTSRTQPARGDGRWAA